MLLETEIELRQVRPGATVPEYKTKGAAALDLCAWLAEVDYVALRPGEQVLIPTGISIHLNNPNLSAVIIPRSGLGVEEGLVLGNGTGLIDSDYQGELKVCLCKRPNSDSYNAPSIIRHGDRIAQLIITPVVRANFNLVNEFSCTSERGAGGFGSTGIN
ncbi:dUTP diphosphatase [Hahella ganghwensis]|uniref:dUTP diphosphatase n=1 Tax=Hahella ganghwensis TaxID=286420 RepID=UPI00036C5E80|nr:dUTP diphosphatase [Hahella ganghwensis]